MQRKSLINRLLLPLLDAAIIFLPAFPATAATPAPLRSDALTGAAPDPGSAPKPFSGRTLQPLALIPRIANPAAITST
ncbi:MAG: hypothetical protein KDE31_17855, partial [Caldilineaceae bacterium]|nr:hypothetical protein [Caldilineaceae bacterium]